MKTITTAAILICVGSLIIYGVMYFTDTLYLFERSPQPVKSISLNDSVLTPQNTFVEPNPTLGKNVAKATSYLKSLPRPKKDSIVVIKGFKYKIVVEDSTIYYHGVEPPNQHDTSWMEQKRDTTWGRVSYSNGRIEGNGIVVKYDNWSYHSWTPPTPASYSTNLKGEVNSWFGSMGTMGFLNNSQTEAFIELEPRNYKRIEEYDWKFTPGVKPVHR